jgi:hypothetical protein
VIRKVTAGTSRRRSTHQRDVNNRSGNSSEVALETGHSGPDGGDPHALVLPLGARDRHTGEDVPNPGRPNETASVPVPVRLSLIVGTGPTLRSRLSRRACSYLPD